MTSFVIPKLSNRKIDIPQIVINDVDKISVIGRGSYGVAHLVQHLNEDKVLKILNCEE